MVWCFVILFCRSVIAEYMETVNSPTGTVFFDVIAKVIHLRFSLQFLMVSITWDKCLNHQGGDLA